MFSFSTSPILVTHKKNPFFCVLFSFSSSLPFSITPPSSHFFLQWLLFKPPLKLLHFPSGFCELSLLLLEWCLSLAKALIFLVKTWFIVAVLPMLLFIDMRWRIMLRWILKGVEMELVNWFVVRRGILINIVFLLWILLSLLWMV